MNHYNSLLITHHLLLITVAVVSVLTNHTQLNDMNDKRRTLNLELSTLNFQL